MKKKIDEVFLSHYNVSYNFNNSFTLSMNTLGLVSIFCFIYFCSRQREEAFKLHHKYFRKVNPHTNYLGSWERGLCPLDTHYTFSMDFNILID